MTGRLSVVTRVVAALAAVVLVFGVTLAVQLEAQRRLVARFSRVHEGLVPVSRQLDEAVRDARSFGSLVAEPDPVVLRQSLRATRRVYPYPARLDAHLVAIEDRLRHAESEGVDPVDDPFVRGLGESIGRTREELRDVSRRTETLLAALEGDATDVSGPRDELVEAVDALARRLAELGRIIDRRVDASLDELGQAEAQARQRTLLSSLLAGLVAVAAAWSIRRSLRPVSDLTRAVTRLGQGEYPDHPIATSRDEFGVLAREFHAMAGAIRDRDERLTRQRDELEGAYREVTTAQQALVQAERLAAIGAITSRVTHELRNPLSSIGLNVEMLAEELARAPDTSADAREMVGVIDREVRRLSDLADRYLSLAREGEMTGARLDAAAIARDVARQQTALLERDGVSIVVDAQGMTTAECDELGLRQVLLNLVRNAHGAITRTQRGGRIGIVLRPDNDSVRVTVHDDGPGVPEAMHARIFEPFVTTRPDGTGLGLGICRSILARWSGDLTVGEGPWGGASFTFRVPSPLGAEGDAIGSGEDGPRAPNDPADGSSDAR